MKKRDASETSLHQRVTPPVLAEEWCISADKVHSWIRSGKLPAYNLGGDIRPRWFIKRKDADEFYESLKVPHPTPETRRRQASEHRSERPFKRYV